MRCDRVKGMFFVVVTVAKLRITVKNVHFVKECSVRNLNKDGTIRKVEIPGLNADEQFVVSLIQSIVYLHNDRVYRRTAIALRTKTQLRVECEEEFGFIPSSGASEQNGKISGVLQQSPLVPLPMGAITVSESDKMIPETELSTVESVSQVTEKDAEDLGNGLIDNNDITETLVDTESEDYQRNEHEQSFAIPDGLAMDPMAPTALAVSSEFMDRIGSGLSILRDHGKKIQKYVSKTRKLDVLKKSWKSIVNVVLVEARDLPDGPAGGSNGVYCKFKLGSESHKTKQVPKSKPTWCDRFNLHSFDDNNLEVTVWHKGKQKNFMGRCTIDLSKLEKERTHELWQELECGYGALHLLVTLSATARSIPLDNVPTTNGFHHTTPEEDFFTWYKLDRSWSEVGQLSVTVHGARGLSALGLSGKADAYCVLELDNSRVQTHTVRGSSEPNWNKSYNFCVNDITSTLDLTVYDESIISSMKGDTLGKISVPLLRINNDEKRWYALKDRSKKSSAKGNCPRILLQMSIVWNPIKASLRVLSPKETKYIQKPPKFDIPLIYSNLLFIKDIFHAIYLGNEHLKRLFEWENREKSVVALIAWLAFWHFFRLWMAPLLLLTPFIYNWTGYRSCNNNALVPLCQPDDETSDDDETQKDKKTIKTRLYGLQDLTFTVKNAIDYIVSLLERIHNLTNYAVPYLSYLVMLVLVFASVVLYIVPVRYLFMALGIYKFTRKFVNPERVPNNDILDFLSRVPDQEILKQWRELKVPEPNLNRAESARRR